ncbi:TetR family transcriptional regulator [Rouxiella badensis]|uniref:TetR family transcriptional regulator n=1 Tax=Rouxiella badensis TaxID=1646377 RepID=UPI00301D0A85
MTHRPIPRVSSRKQPQQARSTELIAAILEAAVRVLAKEGATRFTTARVAETAGVSIGSLYQYFPNKSAILFRLQSDEWRQTTEMLCHILQNHAKTPTERLRKLVHVFIRSECEEAEIRAALSDTAPLYRDAPEAREAKATGERIFNEFMQEALPTVPAESRQRVSDLIATTLSRVGKSFSSTPRSDNEIELYAEAMADMFCAYLKHAQHR